LTEGVSGLVGLPTTIWNAAGNLPQPNLPEINLGPVKLFGEGPYTQVPDVAGMLSKKASDVTGGFTDYTPQTYLGKTVKETGVLAPAAVGAAMTGGTSLLPTVVGGAVLPAIAGTAAGELAETGARMAKFDNPEKYGDAAKFAAEVLTPMGLQRSVNAAFLKKGSAEANTLSRQKSLQTLEDAGIPVTAGSFVNPRANSAALGRDMSYPATAAKLAEQGSAYTNFVLSKIGLPELGVGKNLADTIEIGREALGKDYGDIMSGLSASPTKANIDKFSQILKDSGKTGLPGTSTLFERIKSYKKSGVPIDGQFLSEQRKLLSRNLTSPDPIVREYTKDMLSEFDDMLDDAFTAAGDPDAMQRFADIRGKYRNLLAVEDAAFKSRNAGFENIISPHYMNSQLVSQGKKSMVRGNRGDLGEVTEAAKVYLPKNLDTLKIPSRDPSMFTKAMQAVGGSGLGYGLGEAILPGMGGQIGAPVGFFATQLGGAGLSAAKGKVMGGDLVQNTMKNAALNPQAVNKTISPFLPAAAGYGDPREGRKSGGRVSSHEMAADQLVRAAERAKKGWSAQTEPLLNQSDETVVKALEVANRSI
jgi:hypothetical protein